MWFNAQIWKIIQILRGHCLKMTPLNFQSKTVIHYLELRTKHFLKRKKIWKKTTIFLGFCTELTIKNQREFSINWPHDPVFCRKFSHFLQSDLTFLVLICTYQILMQGLKKFTYLQLHYFTTLGPIFSCIFLKSEKYNTIFHCSV